MANSLVMDSDPEDSNLVPMQNALPKDNADEEAFYLAWMRSRNFMSDALFK
jgi:hypothetical protein